MAAVISLASLIVLIAFQNCGKVASSQIEAASLGKLSVPLEHADKELIVKMKNSEGHAEMVDMAAASGLVNLNESDPTAMAAWNDNNMSLWGWSGPSTPEELKAKLMASEIGGMIEYAEPNYIFNAIPDEGVTQSAVDSIGSIDPLKKVISSDAFNAKLIDLRANLRPIDMMSRPRQIVAVIDSGVDIYHKAFQGADAIWQNPGENGVDSNGNDKRSNGVDDDSNGYVDDHSGFNFRDKTNNVADSTGHGTHCAGLVLATNQDVFDATVSLPIADARKSKIVIMPLKFIGPTGGATSDAINAIFYAAANGAKVLSNSWGGPSYSRALEDAIAYTYDREIVFVAAAGNAATNNDSTAVYPANYKLPNVISVASTDAVDNLSVFSNFGAGSVDIAAPGSRILSTYPNPATAGITNDYYQTLSGTSMATPIVAGLAGLSFYENRLLRAHQVKQVVLDAADPLDSLQGKVASGSRVNPIATISLAKVTTPATSKPVISSSSSSSAAEEAAGAAGCGLVAATKNLPPPGGGQGPLTALLILPLALALALRSRQTIYS
jgi:subtilisin family serine protease